jgi:FkbM family methyltransferase
MRQLVTRYLGRARFYAGLIRQTAGQVDQIAAATEQLNGRLDAVHARIDAIPGAPPRLFEEPKMVQASPANSHSTADSFPIPKFWEPNYWEPTVQFALRDYCKPGQVVFDVGANAGALSMIMSRHVGPKGTVVAFEASPRIIGKTHYNLVNAGCTNVFLMHKAVYHRSHELVILYPGDHLNDSIYNDLGAEGGARYEVETLALDDFVTASGLMPQFIKMDIEGAEFDALQGASRILAEGKPGLVLEQSPSDMRCHVLLTEAGYIAVDLANYRHVKSASDFDAGTSIANILFIHKSKAADDAYVNASSPVEVARLAPNAFTHEVNGSLHLTNRLQLQPGRYVCKADFTADGKDNEIFAGLDSDRGRLMRYHTYSRLMAESYKDWVFAVNVATGVTPYIQFVTGADATLNWKGATILRYPSFDKVKPPVVY